MIKTKDVPTDILDRMAAFRTIQHKTKDSYSHIATYMDIPRATLGSWNHRYIVDWRRVDKRVMREIVDTALVRRRHMSVTKETQPVCGAGLSLRHIVDETCAWYAHKVASPVTPADVHRFCDAHADQGASWWAYLESRDIGWWLSYIQQWSTGQYHENEC